MNGGAGSGELRMEPGEVEQGLPSNHQQLSVSGSLRPLCWTMCTWPSLSGPTRPSPCLTLPFHFYSHSREPYGNVQFPTSGCSK